MYKVNISPFHFMSKKKYLSMRTQFNENVLFGSESGRIRLSPLKSGGLNSHFYTDLKKI